MGLTSDPGAGLCQSSYPSGLPSRLVEQSREPSEPPGVGAEGPGSSPKARQTVIEQDAALSKSGNESECPVLIEPEVVALLLPRAGGRTILSGTQENSRPPLCTPIKSHRGHLPSPGSCLHSRN